MRKFSIVAIITVCLFAAFGFKHAPSKKGKVKWQSTDSVTTRWQQNKKPIIIDLYTDWCHYCKVMDNNTYSNDSLASFINEHYYAAKINAESKKAFNWMGKEYKYINKFKINQLAIELTKGNIVYPTTIILPVEGEPQIIAGAQSVGEMEMILKYFAGDYYGKTNWDDYVKGFKSAW